MSDPADPATSTPSNATTFPAPAPTRRCPECAWGTPSHKPHTPLWPKPVLWITPCLAAVALVIYSIQTTTSFRTGPIYIGIKLVHPIITRADLRAIAAGDSVTRDGKPLELLSTLVKTHQPSDLGFGAVRYQTALTKPPSGSASRGITFGIPFTWLEVHSQRHVRDVVNLAEPMTLISRRPRAPGPYTPPPRGTIEIDPGPNFGPNLVAWTLKPELTRGTVVTVITKYAIALAAIVLAVIAALFTASACRRLARRHPTWSRPVVLIAGGAALLIILFFPDDTGTYRWAVYASNKPRLPVPPPVVGTHTSLEHGASLTTLSLDDLQSCSTPQEADRALAADILRVCDDTADAPVTDLLFAGACIENWNVNTLMVEGPATLLFYSYMEIDHQRCPDFGDPIGVTMPRTNRVQLDWPRLVFLRATAAAGSPVQRLEIDLPGLLAALTLILGPGLIPFLLHRRYVRRRAAKRLRKNLCPSCGYPLPALLTS